MQARNISEVERCVLATQIKRERSKAEGGHPGSETLGMESARNLGVPGEGQGCAIPTARQIPRQTKQSLPLTGFTGGLEFVQDND